MIELADLIQQQPLDTAAIRAAAEPDRYRYIYGAQIEHQHVAAIYALCDALDAARDIAQSQNIEAAQMRAEIAALRVRQLFTIVSATIQYRP